MTPLRVTQDTRMPSKPNKTGLNTFVDVAEERFAWQKPVNDVDAFYTLPTTLVRTGTPFGSSTRKDWESTVKNTRDGNNPYAGPGNYNASNVQVLSTSSSTASLVFGCATRAPSSVTSSPGPCYDISGVFKTGVDNKHVGYGFNKDYRKSLVTPVTDAVYWPQLPNATPAPKIAGRLHVGGPLNGAGNRSPGPVYDTHKYDFKSGPSFSFGSARPGKRQQQDRFKGGLF